MIEQFSRTVDPDTVVCNIVYSAVLNLFGSQPNLLENTPYTHQTEWNISHHLANELARYVYWLDHDLDVVKATENNKRPDIIFHRRGVNLENFLVVEMKRNQSDSASDVEKIQTHWMRSPLSYRYGAYVNIWAKEEYRIVHLRQSRHGSSSETYGPSKYEYLDPKLDGREWLTLRQP